MKTRLLFFVLVWASITAYAQMNVVALHKATGTEIFTGVDPFKAAYNASVAGDTIYLSGGSFVAPANFDKQLYIYGVGHFPDSTAATNPTIITGDFYLTENADNFYLEGVNLKNRFLTVNEASVNAFTVRRTMIDADVIIQGSAVNSTNITFIECVFKGAFTATNMTNSGVFNSIFNSIVQNSNANVYKNNVYLYNGSNYTFHNSSNNEVSNNVIIQTYDNRISNGNGNVYNNNLFVSGAPYYGTSPIVNNSYVGVAQANIFVSQSGNVFDYTHNYNLQDPVTYLGNDGTQVGIYGGPFPFKTASVPITPHISTKNIATSTDNSGQLQINIKVNAQKN